jgi:hypothetical protein
MWTTESLWFEIAIVSILFTVGNMVMGHFEERTPKGRRVGKYVLILSFICGLSVVFGRAVAMIVLSSFVWPLLYVHAYYLPRKKGINGWTGEPKRKYYEFRGWDTAIFSNGITTHNETQSSDTNDR